MWEGDSARLNSLLLLSTLLQDPRHGVKRNNRSLHASQSILDALQALSEMNVRLCESKLILYALKTRIDTLACSSG